MTYYTPPRHRLSVPQILTGILAIFCLFSWMQERDERNELQQTLAALDAECVSVIELSMPVDLGIIQL